MIPEKEEMLSVKELERQVASARVVAWQRRRR